MKVNRLRHGGALVVTAITSVCTAALGAPIQVLINGNPVQFSDQQPVDQNDHVLVPLRGVLEAMGANVRWNPANQAVTAIRGSTTVELAVGSRDASVNGSPVTTDVPAQMIGGRVMVPLRFVSEALGADVHWMDATQTVSIQAAPPGSPTNTNNPGIGGQGNLPGGSIQPGVQHPVVPTPVRPAPTRVQVPVSTDVAVTAFNVLEAGPFHSGDNVQVQLKGTPGGKALFSIGNGQAVQMREVSPGVYRGAYSIPPEARGGEVSITGRLEKNGVSSPLVQAAQPIMISALPPKISQLAPALGATVANVRPTIYALFTPGSSPVNPAGVHIWVNNQDVTAQSTVTPQFVSYTPPNNLPAGPVSVKVEAQDIGGLASVGNWVFTIKPREGIKSLTDNATSALGPGDVLTVTMTGEPGGQAWFSIPGIDNRVPMTETSIPGHYVGTYTVRRGDQFLNQPIAAYLNANGAEFTEKSTKPLTVWTKGAMQPVITSPANGSKVKDHIQVVGVADPDSQVQVTITYEQQSLLGSVLGSVLGGNGNGNVAVENVTADRQGHFETKPVALGGGVLDIGGLNYTIKVVETDAAGQKSQPTVVHVSG